MQNNIQLTRIYHPGICQWSDQIFAYGS